MAYQRETSHRVFAFEYNQANLYEREGNDQFAKSYLTIPTGAKCNRVFVVGTLTEKDDIGKDKPFWRFKVSDPTGTYALYAGQYQNYVVQQLSKIEPPEFVAVVGKTNLYRTEEGATYTSIKPESIQIVDKDTYLSWIVDTAKRTIERLKTVGENNAVMDHYHTNIEEYESVLQEVIEQVDEMFFG